MVRVGIAGIGFMGVTHFKAYEKVEGAQVAAIFTRDARKLEGDWTNVRGNFGGAGGVQDLSGVKRYDDLDALLTDPDIDLVDLCLPSHLHRPVTERALAGGKHVLVEKPIALSVEDADAMIAAAERAGKLLMVAQVLRFWPEFAAIKELIDGGELGAVRGAHFKRIIARPDWSGDNWFSDPAKTGGAVVDLHIHDTDFVQYLFGKPAAVWSTGSVSDNGQVDYLVTEYQYPGQNLCVSAQSGAIAMKGLEFEHGFDVYFERGMLKHNSSTTPKLELYREDGSKEELTPTIPDAFVEQLRTAVGGVASGELPAAIAARSGRDSLATVLAEAESVKSGRAVELGS
ncbi:MAG TPA: Gfo/Idh/MocA family oxidoreductase [Armatimonadota bacterium]|nr:Gfo/Idh/MocA family oxidoreductase [Armatimonadota bacterium]